MGPPQALRRGCVLDGIGALPPLEVAREKTFLELRPSCLGARGLGTVPQSLSVPMRPKAVEGGSFSVSLQGENKPSSIAHHP